MVVNRIKYIEKSNNLQLVNSWQAMTNELVTEKKDTDAAP